MDKYVVIQEPKRDHKQAYVTTFCIVEADSKAQAIKRGDAIIGYSTIGVYKKPYAVLFSVNLAYRV